MTSSEAAIIAAIISSATTIVVAIIDRLPSNRIKKRIYLAGYEQESSKEESKLQRTVSIKNGKINSEIFEQNKAVWYKYSGIIVVLLIASVGFFWHEALFINLFMLPIITFPLSFYRPVRPEFSAKLVLSLYTLTFMGLPASNFFHNRRASFGVEGLFFMVGLCFVNVLILWMIVSYKQRKINIENPKTPTPENDINRSYRLEESSNFTEQLGKLNALYKEGILTKEEFTQAKRKLLGK